MEQKNLNDSFYKNSIVFSKVSDIRSLLEPLSHLDISYFTFDRTYDDGAHIRLTTSYDWIKHYYQHKLFEEAIFEKPKSVPMHGFILWDWLDCNPIYSAARLFDIDHGLTFIEHCTDGYSNFFHFGRKCDKPISQMDLIGLTPAFEHYIAWFKAQAHGLIVEASQSKIYLPQRSLNTAIEPKLSQFFNDTRIKRFYLDDLGTYLTRSELGVVFYLSKGMQSQEIATLTQTSKRTIENHIQNIKEKTYCSTLFELGFRLGQMKSQDFFNICPHKSI